MDETNLSPEDISAMQKQQCVFCHIANGRVASRKVYEDEKFVAVLDINPANPGHMLVLSKEHYMIMPQIPEEDIGHLGMVTKALSMAVLRALKAEGTNIFIANGVIAGQRAQHFIMHVIPRIETDNIGFGVPEFSLKKDQEIVRKLKSSISRVFGFGHLEEPEISKGGGSKSNLDDITNLLARK